jgi:hypothetical protein
VVGCYRADMCAQAKPYEVQGVQSNGLDRDQAIHQFCECSSHWDDVVGCAQVPRAGSRFLPVHGDEIVVATVNER